MDLLSWPVPEGITFRVKVIKMKMKIDFETSFGKAEGTRVITVAEAGGCKGFGEAPAEAEPLYSGEFVDSVVAFAKLVIPKIKMVEDVNGLLKVLNSYRGNNFAKSMIEYSVLTLLSCLRKESLVKAVGGRKIKIPVQESIGIVKDEDELVAWAERALEWGARRLKVKIKPGWDVEPVRALKREFPGVPVLADANGAYDPLKDVHWEYLSKVASYADALEQPFPPHEVAFSAKLASSEGIEVILDESLEEPERVAELAYLSEGVGAPLGVNLKPPRFGGLVKSVETVELIIENELPFFIGGMLETAVGRSLNMTVASLARGNLEPSDFSPEDHLFERGLAKDPFEVKCGFVEVRDSPGLLFEIDEDYLDSVTVSEVVL
ncbi:enolase C-terminal domain-like protein [Ignicoccus hospitalis]|uniref:Mandelate racemase/muconate lactonizing enzyme, C-terminal domain protein n=1 Tax=Ignicoccus hospitalis (strain KIN4/I / DSM 18386 / JCM 14125) TaxID=453591 RepID=A8ABR4_IGNH4|nr:enolase C-terminal domain-like protein [Ignicoccus hospitalis]ABU82366.1 Mandelate racemase/muconate lactonizing enzyme, C-terminal domain protein [Ignicoccus hospitalis KIN4/I]HIH90840.1 hypothetical protein [Desulfurococcaceae archaeon]